MNDVNEKGTVNNAPNETFFVDKSGKDKKQEEQKSSPGSMEFIGKGANRKLDEKWDIHFVIGSQVFVNLITFINQIGYDAIFQFRKREMTIISIDGANTHASTIKFEKTEFSDYNVKGLEKDDDEKIIYIDISIIIDELSVNENFPIDFYVDTLEKNRFYVVNGKEIVRKQLTSTNEGEDSVLKRYKSFLDMMNRLVSNSSYQKIIVNQVPLSNLIKSLSKKKSQKKDETVLIDLLLSKNELDFRIEDDVRGSSIILSGDDILVYPLESDKILFNIEYFNKFGKLKLSYGTAMYICGNRVGNILPVIMEAKFGGGKIVLYYLIAPRVEGND